MDVLAHLRAIQEGAYVAEATDTDYEDDITGEDVDDDALDFDEFDDELMAEATMALLEAEIGPDGMQAFLAEHGSMFIRDQLLTEDAASKSYVVLSPEARRQKAINLMKIRMAKAAGDPAYRKVVAARMILKKYLTQIRSNSRYAKAEQIVRRQRFKLVQNPEAKAAMIKASRVKLQDA
jgi:hypothetical protein